MECLAIDTLLLRFKVVAQVIQAKQQIFQNDEIWNGSVQGFPVSLQKECWFFGPKIFAIIYFDDQNVHL